MYVLVVNQQVEKYPYSVAELRKSNPNISFTRNPTNEELMAFNVFPVKQTEPPPYNPKTHKLELITPVFIDNNWQQQWSLVELTLEELAEQAQALQNSIVAQTQQRLDSFASTRGYDGILSATTYATSTFPKFAIEGQYCVLARDTTWAKLYSILEEVKAGIRPVPGGFRDIEGELPHLEWPA